MGMIRGAVIHVQNEQPLLADLYDMPKALDQGLLCTNLRMMDGKIPVFIERSDSTFFFPYLHIRFIEIMSGSSGLPEISGPSEATQPDGSADEPDLELDEDFLRRIREV